MTFCHGISRGPVVNDDEFDRNTPPVPDDDYEPPAVFDFGSVFTVTQGNANGQVDIGGQQS
jgi:hypothetical protein